MLEEKDVSTEESQASSESSSEEQEQESVEETQPVTEDVESLESDSEAKAKEIADNYRKALKKERERRKKVESQLREVPETSREEYQQPVDSEDEDDIAKRFYKAEANAYFANKMAVDSSFRERADLVRKELEADKTGKLTAEQADERVKVRIFDQMIQQSDEATGEINQQQQIKPTATPEPTEIKPSEDPMQDVLDGKSNLEDAEHLKKALDKFSA